MSFSDAGHFDAGHLDASHFDAGHLVANTVRFGRLLRGLGLGTTTAEVQLLLEALESVSITSRRDFKNAARGVLVHRREHLAIFEHAFELFWSADVFAPRQKIELGRKLERRPPEGAIFVPPPAAADELEGEEVEIVERRQTASGREVLRHKDFAALTPPEAALVRRLMHREVLALAPRRTRRFKTARRGPRFHPRAALRAHLRHGGECLVLPRRKRKTRRRPLVVLCDVSGSMEVYSRLFLQFLYTLKNAEHGGAVNPSSEHFEAFVFGTRLTRVTRQLQHRDVDRALQEAAAAIVDWGGGTRIGESLRAFNFEWGRRVLGRGAVVLVISDGWERGAVDLLDREIARLARHCGRLIWLDPLLGSPGYEPLTRGIRTILPHVDDFLPVHNLASLEDLARFLGEL